MRRVFEGMDRWWAEYHQLYATRNVRIFAQTENRLFLPVTSFVTPMEAGRSLDTPYHALRWAALLETEANSTPENTEPCWHTLPALWAKRRGTVEEKTLLLCSLLLGFSMDAWVCLGTDAHGQPHSWVLTRTEGDTSMPRDVVCWDVRSAERTPADDPHYLASYTSLDVVFNHRRLLLCRSDTVARASLDFGNPRCWLNVPLDDEALSELKLYPTVHLPPFADLRPKVWGLPLELEAIEEMVERRLTDMVIAHRQAAGLPTAIDAHLGQLLQVALVNCELERVGQPAQAALFESLIKHVCTAEQVFRAVPVQFNHLNMSQFWPALSARPAVRALLDCDARSVIGLRARIVQFPEGTVATWVVLAKCGK